MAFDLSNQDSTFDHLLINYGTFARHPEDEVCERCLKCELYDRVNVSYFCSCKRESENEDLGRSEIKTDGSDSKSNQYIHNDDASASSIANVNYEESQTHEQQSNKEGLPRVGVHEQLRNDAGSSELSIRSEMLTGPTGDMLGTSDSDCHNYAVREKWEKTTRPKSRKRKIKPLIPGLTKDWESNDSWTSEKAQEEGNVVAEEIETKRRKIKSLQQKNRRLKVRHSRLKAAIKELKANMADRG